MIDETTGVTPTPEVATPAVEAEVATPAVEPEVVVPAEEVPAQA